VQATQLLVRLDSRYLTSHSNDIFYPPELCQPVEELRAVTVALPTAVEAKRSTLVIVSGAAAEYSTVTKAAENLLKSVDDGATKMEPFGTAKEQLREQQVSSFSADFD